MTFEKHRLKEKRSKAIKDGLQSYADELHERMKQICTSCKIDDDGILREFTHLPTTRGPRKSTAGQPKKPESADYKKKKLERELNELVEDIGLDINENYMMIDITYEIEPEEDRQAKTLLG